MSNHQLSTTLVLRCIRARTGFRPGGLVNHIEVELDGTISNPSRGSKGHPDSSIESTVSVKLELSETLEYFDLMVAKAPNVGSIRFDQDSEDRIHAFVEVRLDSRYLQLFRPPADQIIRMNFIYFRKEDDTQPYVTKSDDGEEMRYVERVEIYLEPRSSEI